MNEPNGGFPPIYISQRPITIKDNIRPRPREVIDSVKMLLDKRRKITNYS